MNAGPVVGIYGGSFDPPHIAHTLVCAYVLGIYEVERVLVVPTAQHPFDKPLSPFRHRLRMCELAMRDIRRVELSRIEQELGGPSFTLRTLEALGARLPKTSLRLVIGSDVLSETASWRDFARVRALAPPIVVPRAGHPQPAAGPALPAVSSTEVRRRLRAGLSTEGLLNPDVARYARDHALYK